MSQHDYNIANQSGAAFRADLNLALMAILSQNSGATEPPVMTPYLSWVDTSSSPSILKIRNAANNGWVIVGSMDTFALASVQKQAGTYYTTSGGSSAFTVSPTPAGSNTAGYRYRLQFHSTPTGTPTLQVSGDTPAALKYKDYAGVKHTLTSFQAVSGWRTDVEFDGTDWIVLDLLQYDLTEIDARLNALSTGLKFEGYEQFTTVGATTFTVPEGVYDIFVGSRGGGGGGGGLNNSSTRGNTGVTGGTSSFGTVTATGGVGGQGGYANGSGATGAAGSGSGATYTAANGWISSPVWNPEKAKLGGGTAAGGNGGVNSFLLPEYTGGKGGVGGFAYGWLAVTPGQVIDVVVGDGGNGGYGNAGSGSKGSSGYITIRW